MKTGDLKIMAVALVLALACQGQAWEPPSHVTMVPLRPAADVAVWRGIVFGTNWSDVADMVMMGDSCNPFLASGLRCSLRRREALVFGGLPLEHVQYAVLDSAVVGVRITFDMRYYDAMLAKCVKTLGPCGVKRDNIMWLGKNVLVLMWQDAEERCGKIELMAAPVIDAVADENKRQVTREFQ